MSETAHFVNDGFGWECRRCRERGGAARADGQSSTQGDSSAGTVARFFREGEAEGGGPRLSSDAQARWADESRTRLRCAVCGVEEELKG